MTEFTTYKKATCCNTKWPWPPKGQRYPVYVELLSMSRNFHSVLLYDLHSIEVCCFSIAYNGEFDFYKKKSLKIRNLKCLKKPKLIPPSHFFQSWSYGHTFFASREFSINRKRNKFVKTWKKRFYFFKNYSQGRQHLDCESNLPNLLWNNWDTDNERDTTDKSQHSWWPLCKLSFLAFWTFWTFKGPNAQSLNNHQSPNPHF